MAKLDDVTPVEEGFGFMVRQDNNELVALFAFNVGVEFGQLAIVAGLLPVLFLMRRSSTYTQVALPAGSMVIMVIGVTWILQRATGINIIPG